MDDGWLDDLWRRNRGPCYERHLKFSTLAHLIADALLEHKKDRKRQGSEKDRGSD
jgi:hypothetical protein